jgi:hypothetical protein
MEKRHPPDIVFKKDQSLHPSKVLGGAFDEGRSRYDTAVAVYVR